MRWSWPRPSILPPSARDSRSRTALGLRALSSVAPRGRTLATAAMVLLAAGPLPAQQPPPGGDGPPGDRVVTLTDTLPGAVGGVTVDATGTIYVADFGEHVWKVTPDGRVTLFASGLYGASGNAVDSKGALYQSSFNGNFVSRIDRAGNVEELADGLQGPVGIAIDDRDDLYVTNCTGNSLSKITREGEVTEFSTSELYNCPNGITRDSQGNLYVVNFSDGKVLSVAPDGTASELAELPGGGNGHITFARGGLYATSFRGHQVWRISLDGQIQLVAGTGQPGGTDGAALQATFFLPNGIAVNPRGNRLYVNEFRVRPTGTELVPPAPKSVLRQIKLASLSDLMVAALDKGGVDAMDETYRAFKADPSTAGLFTEVEVNALGYRFMTAGRMEAALRVFELNAESYPGSWNVWDSLAEAHMNLGHRERAIELYEKSVAMNPANTNGIAKLEELGAR